MGKDQRIPGVRRMADIPLGPVFLSLVSRPLSHPHAARIRPQNKAKSFLNYSLPFMTLTSSARLMHLQRKTRECLLTGHGCSYPSCRLKIALKNSHWKTENKRNSVCDINKGRLVKGTLVRGRKCGVLSVSFYPQFYKDVTNIQHTAYVTARMRIWRCRQRENPT